MNWESLGNLLTPPEKKQKTVKHKAHDSSCIIATWIVQSLALTLTSAALLLPSGVRPHLGKLIGCIVGGPILGLLDTQARKSFMYFNYFSQLLMLSSGLVKHIQTASKMCKHKYKTTEQNQFDYRFIPVGQLA